MMSGETEKEACVGQKLVATMISKACDPSRRTPIECRGLAQHPHIHPEGPCTMGRRPLTTLLKLRRPPQLRKLTSFDMIQSVHVSISRVRAVDRPTNVNCEVKTGAVMSELYDNSRSEDGLATQLFFLFFCRSLSRLLS